MFFDDEIPFNQARALTQLGCQICTAEGQPSGGRRAFPRAAASRACSCRRHAPDHWEVDRLTSALRTVPAPSRLRRGPNGAFANLGQLREHLKTAHKKHMCSVCLEGRKAFVSQQFLYSQVRRRRRRRSSPSSQASIARWLRGARTSISLLQAPPACAALARSPRRSRGRPRPAARLRLTLRSTSAAARPTWTTSSAPRASRRADPPPGPPPIFFLH